MNRRTLLFISLASITIPLVATIYGPRPWNPLPSSTATGFACNYVSLQHTKLGHPESASRTQVILNQLKRENLLRSLVRLTGRAATLEELTLVHTPEYVQQIQDWAKNGETYLYREKWAPYRSAHVWESATTAAGSLIDLVTAVAEGRLRNGFALLRPPGHHATRDHGMGFCIFNNVALATQYLHRHRGIDRVAIVDLDAHHGNGTESIFKDDPRTLYVSLHQGGFYPYSGDVSTENILNLPLPFQARDSLYKKKMEEFVLPRLEDFHPQMILVSMGYDGHWLDSMSNLGLTLQGYAWLSQRLVQAANSLAQGKIVFALEGGYDLDALSIGAANTVKALLGRDDFMDPLGEPPF